MLTPFPGTSVPNILIFDKGQKFSYSLYMPLDLTKLLSPASIAIIGASRSPEKVGAIILKNIRESKFAGKIYPVNPNTATIDDLQCFPDIKNLPEAVDLAVIALPAPAVSATIQELGEKGIKNVVVISAGFKETGPDGAKLEQELIDKAQQYDINVLGPNCLGFVNNQVPVNVTFGQPVRQSGTLRFISQSGAIAAALFDWCNSTGLGFSDFVTLGNKAVVNENDVLNYFLTQASANGTPEVLHPIGLYLESITNGSDFLKITTQLSKTNPLFIIKPGKTQAAAKAMQSHTGAIAGEDAILQTALDQAGIVRCETLEDFFDAARAFAWEKAPAGPKVAIISNAGGPAVISADAVVTEGLELAEFDEQTNAKLLQVLPRSASIHNPVDVLGDALADRVASAAEIILQTDQADALIVILTPQVMTQIEKTAELIGELSKKYQKPIFCSFIGGGLVTEGEQKLNEAQVPSFRFPERAIAAFGAMWRWKKWQLAQTAAAPVQETITTPDPGKIREVIDKAVQSNQKTLNNFEANALMEAIGIAVPATRAVDSLQDALSFTDDYGWPVVLKLSSPGLLHKADIGAVMTDMVNEAQLEKGWNNLEKKLEQLAAENKTQVTMQIQKEIMHGVEVIVGIKNDPTFGPVMLFGAGGKLTELIADKNLHLLPVNKAQAKELVERSRIFTYLKGYRGEPPYALDKLYELLVRLGKLAAYAPEASEIEINPVIVTFNDAWAVDSKVVLKEGQPKAAPTLPAFKVATTIENTVLATTYHYLTFETEQPLQFTPGQYVSIKVANTRINCYSIAGHEGTNKFHLLIDTSPGGPGSKYFESLKAGEKIAFLGPFGTFTLKPEDGAKHLVFMGTGSGLAPLICMIEAALKETKTQLPISLYFGLRFPADVFWQDYLQKLAQEYPNFTYKIVLSKPDDAWQGLKGHITDIAGADFPDACDCSIYLCGSKAMIDESVKILTGNKCPQERIYFEKF